MSATAGAQAPRSGGLFSNLANPVIRKMEKKGEYGSDNAATYSGIVGKTVWFLMVTVIGVFVCFIMHQYFLSTGAQEMMHFADDNSILDFYIHPTEAIIMIAVLVVSIIVPFLSWFFKGTIPVVGTIYCAAQGVLVGFITVALNTEYKFISVLAVIITAALVAAMLFVYAKRIIKVTARFRGIITTLFIGAVLSGLIFFVLSLIPSIRNSAFYAGLSKAMNNPVLSIVLSVVLIVIACLFMLVDFDTIERCVENRLDKKYEWMAAWGLAYTILYIYFKILRILITIFGKSKSSD